MGEHNICYWGFPYNLSIFKKNCIQIYLNEKKNTDNYHDQAIEKGVCPSPSMILENIFPKVSKFLTSTTPRDGTYMHTYLILTNNKVCILYMGMLMEYISHIEICFTKCAAP